MREQRLISDSADVTRAIGARLGAALLALQNQPPVIINLSGELGAGKTTFVGGLLRAMGVTGSVRSPTYTLIEPYELTTHAVYHLDLYRLSNARELDMLALRDLLLPSAVLLVEWAERGEGALPSPDLTLELQYPEAENLASGQQSDRRSLGAVAFTQTGEALLNKLVATVS